MPHSQLPGAALGADGLPAGNEGADINNPLFPGYFQVSYPMAPEFYDGITIPESSVPYYEWPQVYDYYNYPVTFLAPEYRKYPLTPDQYEDLYWVNMYSPFKDSSGNSILSNDEYGYPVRIPGTTEDIPTPVEFRDLFNQWQNYCFDAPTWSPQINNVNYNY
tara:strand:+ start:18719 stop:19204 length:486 start_codon:yes stop_codon:yes gene_type:complete